MSQYKRFLFGVTMTPKPIQDQLNEFDEKEKELEKALANLREMRREFINHHTLNKEPTAQPLNDFIELPVVCINK